MMREPDVMEFLFLIDDVITLVIDNILSSNVQIFNAGSIKIN